MPKNPRSLQWVQRFWKKIENRPTRLKTLQKLLKKRKLTRGAREYIEYRVRQVRLTNRMKDIGLANKRRATTTTQEKKKEQLISTKWQAFWEEIRKHPPERDFSKATISRPLSVFNLLCEAEGIARYPQEYRELARVWYELAQIWQASKGKEDNRILGPIALAHALRTAERVKEFAFADKILKFAGTHNITISMPWEIKHNKQQQRIDSLLKQKKPEQALRLLSQNHEKRWLRKEHRALAMYMQRIAVAIIEKEHPNITQAKKCWNIAIESAKCGDDLSWAAKIQADAEHRLKFRRD